LPPSDAEYSQAIVFAARNGANAIMVADNTDIYENRVLIADLIKQVRLPAIYAVPGFVEVGGLMAFEADYIELCQRVAVDIDAVLRRAEASDIPFYRGNKFDLTINPQTAKEFGLTVPPALLAQATEVIE
jgi:putative ABC transport system substrate-binding protein